MGNASLCVTCHSGLFPRGGGSTTHGPAIIDALAPLGAKMPEGEPIGIRVGWKINITLGSNGVRREENEDIPL